MTLAALKRLGDCALLLALCAVPALAWWAAWLEALP